MKNLDYREYYHRHLPHIQPRGATFLVNFRLAGSLPDEVMDALKNEAEESGRMLAAIDNRDERYRIKDIEQRRLFGKWDDALHKSLLGPFYLKEDRIAEIVANSIRYHDGEWFEILAYCIMPNHVHAVLTPFASTESTDYSLTKIMHHIKRNSAKLANAALGRTGAFWQHESYDHFARDEAELERIIKYVIYNPVKAGLVDDWTKWKWTYCKYDF